MSKEHAYAYEAGYRDGSIHYELEHCPACKNVADLQEVLEENAKLRESVKRLMTQRNGRLARAEADNAELRELARQMYPKAKAFLQMGVRLGCNDTLSYDWYLQLHELGVEVDA